MSTAEKSMNERRLIVKIIQFFRNKCLSGDLEADQKESLDVACQCLEQTFNVNTNDPSLQTNIDLFELFSSQITNKIPTEAEKTNAENLKNEGNNLMKDAKYEEAVKKYTEAILLWNSPIFYCNRAAAYSKLDKNEEAVSDCKTALQLDPTYSKAYGRMGLAFSGMGKYKEAQDAYEKALEIEPDNESFKNNLQIAKEKVRETDQRMNMNPADMFGGLNMAGFNPMQILNNPAIAQMTQQLIADPNMQNMMRNFMGGLAPPAANQPPAAGANANVGDQQANNAQPNLDRLMQMGEMLAAEMQAQNPQLVEQLRREFQQRGPAGNAQNNEQPENNQQPPPPPPQN